MIYKLGEDDFTVNFGLSKRRIPYSPISNVQLSHTTLLLRLFGASWSGLHWGLYKAKDVGRVWVYSTKMRGDFVLMDLVNGKKIAISPEDPKVFLEEIDALKSRFGTASPSEVERFETSTRVVYIQVVAIAAAFVVFLGYLLWIYPSLPEIIPVHFDFNWNHNRWAHKSELFIVAGVAAIFPVVNTILALMFGKWKRTDDFSWIRIYLCYSSILRNHIFHTKRNLNSTLDIVSRIFYRLKRPVSLQVRASSTITAISICPKIFES